MTPAARLQAAIELLDEIVAAARDAGAAADTIGQRYFKQRRYAGSGDRRAIRELVYRAIRRFGERPANGRAAMLGLAAEDPALLLLFDGSRHGPSPPDEQEPRAEGEPLSGWMIEALDPLVRDEDPASLLARAPLDLRVNRIRGGREAALAAIPAAEPAPHAPLGLRLPEGFRIEAHEAWNSGLVEIQDEGSQLAVAGCGAASGMLVVDLCAGAGGKTLALAAEMDNQGRIVACDTNRARLQRLPPRAERAGVSIVETRLLDPSREMEQLEDLRGSADLVLVDAPCSGSGTWRRNPETRWRLSPERLGRLTVLQAYLLDLAAELVRPGGHLVYVVCSLFTAEGRDQAAAFAGRRSSLISLDPAMAAGRPSGAGRLLTSAHDGTDGFFIARWQRPC